MSKLDLDGILNGQNEKKSNTVSDAAQKLRAAVSKAYNQENEAQTEPAKKGFKKEEGVQLRLLLLSDMELGTKLNDPLVDYNIGEIIKNYDKRIDGIIINGGLAYIPDKYSRWRGERLDLLEDKLKERYGNEIYREVKKGGKKNDTVDDLKEAVRLARFQVSNIVKQANDRGIDILYFNGNTDYRNIKMIMEALERLGRNNSRRSEDADDDIVADDDLSRLLSILPEDYIFKASDWKTTDKKGIKDKAINIYSHIISTIFGNGDAKRKVKFYKRFENFLGTSTKGKDNPEEFAINGLKVKGFDSIDGLTIGLSEGIPSKMHEKNTERYAMEDAKLGRLADLYITFGSMTTEFTAANFSGRDRPVYFFNQSPLLDIDKQLRLRAAFNKTRDSKILNRDVDSSLSIITVYKDGIFEIDRLTVDGIRKNVNISEIESKLKDGSMHETVGTSDWHVGSQFAMYEEINYLPKLVDRVTYVPKGLGRKHAIYTGDEVDGGNDKLSRTRMQVTYLKPQEEIISDLDKNLTSGLEDVLKSDSVEAIEARLKQIKETFSNTLGDILYGNPTIDITAQFNRLSYYIKPLSRKFDDSYIVGGNHAEKATGNGSEGQIISPMIRDVDSKVVLVDEYLLKNEFPRIGNYKAYITHSAGYRGGLDPATALFEDVVRMGADVDLAIAGDSHEPRIKFGIRRVAAAQNNGQNSPAVRWGSLISMITPALQRYTTFESNIIHKLNYTKGVSVLYLPADESISSSYVKYRFIPAQTIDMYMNLDGGTRIDNLVDKLIDSVSALKQKEKILASSNAKG
ncbi:MAG: hypothetical protein ACP5RE_00780 [Candidatus Acidifodinimicrobium sp.]